MYLMLRALRSTVAGLAAVLITAAMLVGPLSGRAAAHASLVGSDPSPDSTLQQFPASVAVTFDEPVSVDLAGIRIYGPDGERVERGSTRLENGDTTARADLEPGREGTYTVAWTVVSTDSHVLTGSFVFHVGARTGGAFVPADRGPAIDVAGWAARWLALSGAVVLVGVTTYVLAIDTSAATGRRLRIVALAAAAAAAAGALGRFVVQVMDTTGRSFPGVVGLLDDAIDQTRVGRIDVLRLGLGIAALVAAWWWPRPGAVVAAGSTTAAALACNSISGHAWSVDHQSLAVVVDVVHQLAGAVWIGGLVALVVTQVAQSDPGMLRRFTTLVGGSLGIVVLTGAVSSWLQVRTSDALTDTTYGRTLAVKVGLVMLTAAAGVAARARLHREAIGAGRRVLAAELVFAVAVLGTTAALVDIVPGRDYRSGPYGMNARDELGTVSITVDPARAGDNALHLYFFDDTGAPRRVDVAEATVATGDLPPRAVELFPITTGHYSAVDLTLPNAGRWRFTVTTLSEGRPATLQFEVPIR